MNQSELLTKFYVAIWAWIQSDFKTNPKHFDKEYGICSNLVEFLTLPEVGMVLEYYKVTDELTTQLSDAFSGDHSYPFNNGWCPDYVNERNKYTNLQRLEWIKNHLPQQQEN